MYDCMPLKLVQKVWLRRTERCISIHLRRVSVHNFLNICMKTNEMDTTSYLLNLIIVTFWGECTLFSGDWLGTCSFIRMHGVLKSFKLCSSGQSLPLQCFSIKSLPNYYHQSSTLKLQQRCYLLSKKYIHY